MKKFTSKRKLKQAYEDMQLIVHKNEEHIEYLNLIIGRQEAKIERLSKENEHLKRENETLKRERLNEPVTLEDLISKVDFLKVKKAADDYSNIGIIKVRKIR